MPDDKQVVVDRPVGSRFALAEDKLVRKPEQEQGSIPVAGQGSIPVAGQGSKQAEVRRPVSGNRPDGEAGKLACSKREEGKRACNTPVRNNHYFSYRTID